MAEADPQKTFNIHEAKTQFSRLVDRAHAGEEIVVAKDGVPYAKLVPIARVAPRKRVPGRFHHLLKDVPSDIWFEPAFTDSELDAFGDIPPSSKS
jgi:prevent-host-death family protein